MPLEYVRVKPLVDLFSPAVRPTGAIAIVGTASAGVDNVPVLVSSPSDATDKFGAPFDTATPPGISSALTRAIHTAFAQSPGPSQVWGVKTSGTNFTAALTEVEKLDVQFVVLANTLLTEQNASESGPIKVLSDHVTTVSNAGDGKERMGVAMLASGNVTKPASTPANDRMVYVAHKSTADVAAAVAGTIAGYDPHVSMVLKKVNVASDPFTNTEIETINGPEEFDSPPNGNGVIWLTKPALLSGGVYLGEGYTGSKDDRKYIDIVRTLDDISFKLKARLIRTIGTLRISRSGLRGLSVQLEAILNREVADGVIEGYTIVIPLLPLLDADPRSLSEAQLKTIANAQNDRVAELLVSVDYAGAFHRVALKLKFD